MYRNSVISYIIYLHSETSKLQWPTAFLQIQGAQSLVTCLDQIVKHQTEGCNAAQLLSKGAANKSMMKSSHEGEVGKIHDR